VANWSRADAVTSKLDIDKAGADLVSHDVRSPAEASNGADSLYVAEARHFTLRTISSWCIVLSGLR
jgi:hypothetical protein